MNKYAVQTEDFRVEMEFPANGKQWSQKDRVRWQKLTNLANQFGTHVILVRDTKEKPKKKEEPPWKGPKNRRGDRTKRWKWLELGWAFVKGCIPVAIMSIFFVFVVVPFLTNADWSSLSSLIRTTFGIVAMLLLGLGKLLITPEVAALVGAGFLGFLGLRLTARKRALEENSCGSGLRRRNWPR